MKFPRNLRGEVLHRFDGQATGEQGADGATLRLGSLGPAVPTEFNRQFDIVIGNPPWTRLREAADQLNEAPSEQTKGRSVSDKQNDFFTALGRRVLNDRGLSDLARTYRNPDKNPDIPFLLRSTEWAQEDGLLAFALPARLFHYATRRGSEPWQAILRVISITGLINGADLRKTAVWKDVDVPWCLLFARNVPAKPGHRFYYAAPSYESLPNQEGRFRIDYETAQPISAEQVSEEPWLLKALSFGTWRDVRLIRQIKAAFPETVIDHWMKWNPQKDKTGQGYNRTPGKRQKPAAFLGPLKDFKPIRGQFAIPYSSLSTYEETHESS